MAEIQNYQNHVRWYPLVHFVIMPLLLLNLLWQFYQLYQERNLDRIDHLLLALVLILINLAARLQALRAQDRVIRLEERMRFKEILPVDLASQAMALRTSQILALRFASDEELPEIVRRTLNGELKTNKEIKMAIKNWRGDYLRV